MIFRYLTAFLFAGHDVSSEFIHVYTVDMHQQIHVLFSIHLHTIYTCFLLQVIDERNPGMIAIRSDWGLGYPATRSMSHLGYPGILCWVVSAALQWTTAVEKMFLFVISWWFAGHQMDWTNESKTQWLKTSSEDKCNGVQLTHAHAYTYMYRQYVYIDICT